MAYLAAHTNAGTRKRVNEDACCLEVAQTPLGEILMVVVCDGVGGLAKGDIASSTVINRFSTWFERELAVLVEGMVAKGSFDFALVQAVWGTHLQTMNELIRNYGAKIDARLGTTFTGMIVCNGRYLVAHVGDCRAYRMNAGSFEQITQDQTLVAKRLAAGEITEEEARRAPKNVILQSVGTERVVKPAYYEGTVGKDDLVVICCDGAYHRAENEGIRKLFQGLDYRNEAALQGACQTLIQYDMDCGEKDNLTIVCFSGDLAAAGEIAAAPSVRVPEATRAAASRVTMPAVQPVITEDDDLETMVGPDDEPETMVGFGDDAETMVGLDDDLETMVGMDNDLETMVAPGNGPETMVGSAGNVDLETMVGLASEEDDLVTTVEPEADEDELVTMVESEDDLATMVEPDVDEDDLATMVGPAEEGPVSTTELEDELDTMVETDEGEDDLATMVESDGDEDELDTMVETDEDEDDLATMVESDGEDLASLAESEDDLATMVADDEGSYEDGLATMVEFDSDKADLATVVGSEEHEDDLATMVADDDDVPTMVEGVDA